MTSFPSKDNVNIGSGYGLLLDGAKPTHDPVWT